MLLNDIKIILRVSANSYDDEITGLIESAIKDLNITGIDKAWLTDINKTPIEDEEPTVVDPLIKRAIALYCKAHFGYDNADHERLLKAYELLKGHLSISIDYEVEA